MSLRREITLVSYPRIKRFLFFASFFSLFICVNLLITLGLMPYLSIIRLVSLTRNDLPFILTM